MITWDALMSFKIELQGAIAFYTVAGLLALAASLRPGRRDFRIWSRVMLGAGLAANVWWLVDVWRNLGHPPFADNFGCTVLLAACVALVALVLDILLSVRFAGALSMFAAAGLVVFSMRFAADVQPLEPALQSIYFAPHVLAYFIAYGALSVAALAALVLIVARATGAKPDASLIEGLRKWVLRAGEIGLPFLTIGIVLGAFWAQSAWGDYWAWDPKETWALITWLLTMAWWHLWRSGSRGVVAAAVLMLATTALYFTYLGVGILPTAIQSLHTYGPQ
jgi:ABC-type transport system involved in cytochrome c biogenesis permease subunit